MSNSSLVDYTIISPNKNSPRNNQISKITIHHMAGNLSIENCGAMFAKTSRQASSNYGIGSDGRVGLYVDEKDRSWCSSSPENDHCAVTIEVANDEIGGNWHVSDKALAKLIDLCTDICKRNGISKLNYTGNKSGNLTMHKWFAATACPGPYLESKFPYIASEVNKRLSGQNMEMESTLQASSLKDLPRGQIVEMLGPIFTEDQKKTGVLASVSMAQFLLESNYAQSELAQKANNCFGMKKNLSGNTWKGTTWDGSVYQKNTQEYMGFKYVTITSEFRKYKSISDSIEDHSAYLVGAMNGSKNRYPAINKIRDYKRALTVIKDGGYATSPTYVENLCKVVENWNLTRFDVKESNTDVEENGDMKLIYPEVPFLVTVLVNDLNYRSAPSMNGKINGVTGKGIFTITSVNNGWGHLKSGVGWIYLENPEYVSIPGATYEKEVDVWESNGPWKIEGATGADKQALKDLCEKYGLKVSLI